ncbi:MAG: SPOR domain-containing protein [Paludibacteraceae bacterium]|nr:SPOR domain-containing protein [Paludibacteraceae bacterium]
MRHLFAILFAILPFTCILANDSIKVTTTPATSSDSVCTFILDAMPNAQVIQSEAIRKLVRNRYKIPVVNAPKAMRGFRVQIYSSNKNGVAMEQAYRLERDVTIKLGLPVYVQADPPYWKVRVGDFKEKEDADKFAVLIKKYYPQLSGSIYVVPDRIIITK